MERSLAAVFPRLGHLPVFGPILAATGNPVAANQLNLLANFTLSGTALYALLRHWGVCRAAAFLAGFIYAFCPARVSAAATPSLVAGQYLPLGILFLDRAASRRSWPDSILASGFLTWQAGCALIYAYLVPFVGLVYLALFTIRKSPGRIDPRLLTPFVSATIAMGLIVSPTIAAVNAGLLESPIDISDDSSSSAAFLKVGSVDSWTDYLSRDSFFRSKGNASAIALPLYMGWSTLLFCLLGLTTGATRIPTWVKQLLLTSTAAAVLLSLGPCGDALTHVWMFVGQIVPGASTLLLPSHFGFLFVLTTSLFAGVGLDRIVRQASRSIVHIVLAAVVALMVGWELKLRGHGHGLEVQARSPYEARVYSILRQQPYGSLLEIPFDSCRMDANISQARTMSDSVAHWRPILNGLGELRHTYRDQLFAISSALPDPRALDLLVRIANLRHVIAHTSRIPVEDRYRWLEIDAIREVAFADGRLLMEVKASDRPRLTERFRILHEQATTLLGNPVSPVPLSGRAMGAHVEFESPSSTPGIPIRIRATIHNLSSQSWPVLGGNPDQQVQIAYRWESPDGTPLSNPRLEYRKPLPFDLGPGESVSTTLCVVPPAAKGKVELVVGVAQGRDWFHGNLARASLRLRKFAPIPFAS